VWSTRTAIDSPGDEDYYVYTILTRTRSILIIALFDETPARYREIVGLFARERVLVWDGETGGWWGEQIANLKMGEIIPTA
jgi:hypothetical protein